MAGHPDSSVAYVSSEWYSTVDLLAYDSFKWHVTLADTTGHLNRLIFTDILYASAVCHMKMACHLYCVNPVAHVLTLYK